MKGVKKMGETDQDIEQPLLEKNKQRVYENCPGCRNSYLQHPDAKLPMKELAIVSAATLVHTLPISSLFPFLYFMVKDFDVASERDIGFYAGYIGSVYMLGRFLTSVQWGLVADRYGRKPVIIIGILSVIVFHTMFGASKYFWMAMIARFLMGSINGMGTIKAYATEICSEQHQARCLSVMSVMWGFGLIVGPAIGGYLSQPAIKFPTLFPAGSLFDRYAYLLPSLCITVPAILVLFIALYLPFENVNYVAHRENMHHSQETVHNHDIEGTEDRDDVKQNDSVAGQILRLGSRKNSQCALSKGFEDPMLVPSFGRSSSCKSDTQVEEGDALHHNLKDRVIEAGLNGANEVQGNGVNVAVTEDRKKLEAGQEHSSLKKNSLLTGKALIGSISVTCIYAFHDIAYTEIFSLWCVSPASNGGLSYTTHDVGNILAISGLSMLIFQLVAFTPLVDCMGSILVVRTGSAMTVLLLAAYPFMPILHGMKLWVILSLASNLRVIFGTMIFTGSFILVNNSVTIKERGAANGILVSAISLFKAVGPAAGGSVFAWAQRRQDAYILPGSELFFFFLAASAFLTFLATFEPFLPKTLDRPIESYTE